MRVLLFFIIIRLAIDVMVCLGLGLEGIGTYQLESLWVRGFIWKAREEFIGGIKKLLSGLVCPAFLCSPLFNVM